MRFLSFAVLAAFLAAPLWAQPTVPPSADLRMYDIATAPSAERLEADVRMLADFGTRHTLSDTTSATRGIGAARRWIKAEFDAISAACGGCLEVYYHTSRIAPGESQRIPDGVDIVNVVAIQRGTRYPDRYVMMAGDIDSRATDVLDGLIDAPGANDNATGMAGALEAARVLTPYTFPSSIAYVGLSGEEQGLFGGRALAATAVEEEWDLVAVLNNDMIGNIAGIDGVIDNTSFRIFSEPVPATDELRQHQLRRFYGGEVDGPSRQLARYIARVTEQYTVNLNPMLIYRLDRFGRGGHHRPFNEAGFAGVRIMETHEHYDRQHQDLRNEEGRHYGDTVEFVDFDYTAALTGVNALTLAGLAWAPPAPTNVGIGGAVRPSTTLAWDAVDDPNLAGYKLYWRLTTAPQWTHSRFVGPEVTSFTLDNLVIDNYLFGVAAVGQDGHESVVAYPSRLVR
ncbi:MAG: M28 family metallopeptidase [Bacteroidota bacterium]